MRGGTVRELGPKMTEDCKIMLRRALELLESGKGSVPSFSYDERS